MLTEKNLKEIFCAFIASEDFRPSAGLFKALAGASGKTEADLRDVYKAYSRYLTGMDGDPLKRPN
ncbi:MAG TPA: hypothetical protein VJR58_10545 [Vineibacter sp.]|nr:hypothetical protein [Vineibacter sp.]